MLAAHKKSLKNIGLALAVAMAPLPAYADTLLDAIAALDAGQYEQAYTSLESMAQGGDHEAEYTLCMLYSEGVGRPRDEDRAFELCKRAAVGGQAGAQHQLGLMYMYGTGTASDGRLATNWLSKSADAGYR